MENKELDQDRVEDTIDHFKRFGYVMFPQNKKTYQNIAQHSKRPIFEAGGGMGLGAYILDAQVSSDKLPQNVKFAQELYPKIQFEVWDITQKRNPFITFPSVVCVEAIEHVSDTVGAIRNLVDSADKEVWISTPNSEEDPPSNPFHVKEFTPKKMVELIKEVVPDAKITIHHWDTFAVLDENTKVSPLIYHIEL